MLVNYTKKDEMVHIYSNHESKDECSRMGRWHCKLKGQAGGRGMLWLFFTGIIVFEFTALSKQQTAAIRQGTVRLVARLLRGDSAAEGEAIFSPAFTAWCFSVIFRAGALPPVLLDIGANPDDPPPFQEELFLSWTVSCLSFHVSCKVLSVCPFLIKMDHLEPPFPF